MGDICEQFLALLNQMLDAVRHLVEGPGRVCKLIVTRCNDGEHPGAEIPAARRNAATCKARTGATIWRVRIRQKIPATRSASASRFSAGMAKVPSKNPRSGCTSMTKKNRRGP